MRTNISKLILIIVCHLFLSVVLAADDNTAEIPQKDIDTAQDILLLDPYLSLRYQKGPYLVYDCVDMHWVCTAKPEFEFCDKQRQQAVESGRKYLPCAPIEKYKNEIQCHRTQIVLTNIAYQNRFCLHPQIRKRDVEF